MILKRIYEPLDRFIQANKVLVIYGPRQVGKTTLLRRYLQDATLKWKLVTGDDIRVQKALGSLDLRQLLEYVEGYELLAIDEAQAVPSIGAALKLLVDEAPGLHLVVTGSSSFELAGQIGEPLTGRKRTLSLFPIAQMEMLAVNNRYELREQLEDRLLYGAYPAVLTAATRADRLEVLNEIAHSYVLKDILAFERLRNSRILNDLLRLLAFQIGREVSLNELATQLGIDVKTVQRYLDLLEQAFVLVRLGGFSRNLRKEVTSKAKYYFFDTGLRNALIAQFNPLAQRDDVGMLWENFLVLERLKYRTYADIYANAYFWRTYDQQEIDLVEERDGALFGYEFKWSARRKVAAPIAWRTAYPAASFHVITPENYLDFVAPQHTDT